jgi:DNA-directed RNA polymerase specialized sigma24 family protein
MNLLPFYKYIRGQFVRKCRDRQLAEDITQDFFLYFWINKHKVGQRISIKFIHVATEYFYKSIRTANRQMKRSGEMIPIEKIFNLTANHSDEERIYSQQLFSIVENLTNTRLREAILFYIDKLTLSKGEAKYWEIIKSHQPMLMRRACVY